MWADLLTYLAEWRDRLLPQRPEVRKPAAQSQRVQEADADRVPWDRVDLLLPILVFAGLLGVIAVLPVQLPADGHEYLGAVASLLATHNLSFDPEDKTAMAQMVSPETYVLDMPHGQAFTTNPRTGQYMWGPHSIWISAIALPFVFVFGAKGFLVMNACCFAFMMWIVYRHLRECNPQPVAAAVAVACLLPTAVPSYVFWVNSEMLLMAALAAALYYGLRLKMYRAVLFLGIASSIKPPLGVVFFLLAGWQFAQRRSFTSLILTGLAFAAALTPHVLYEFITLGRASINSIGAEEVTGVGVRRFSDLFRFVTPLRLWTFWFAPASGLIWFYPTILWCIFRTRYNRWMVAGVCLVGLMVSIMCLTPVNFISGSEGIRYTTLVFPLFLFLGGSWRSTWADWLLIGVALLLGGALLTDATDATRKPAWGYGQDVPSMALVEHCGVPVYPEQMFLACYRQPRDIVGDYVDNEGYLRNNAVKFMIRNALPGQAIFQFMPRSDVPPSVIRYGAIGRRLLTHKLVPGWVNTIEVPLEKTDFQTVAYPDWVKYVNPSAPTARLRMYVSRLDVISGTGELRWQQRLYEGHLKFLYEAGPRLLAAYPSYDWILQTVAAEDLEDTPAASPETLFETNRDSVKTEWDTKDAVEGTASLRITVPLLLNPHDIKIASRTPISLENPVGRSTDKIEVSGFFKVPTLARHALVSGEPKADISIEWLDNKQEHIAEAEIQRLKSQDKPSWTRFASAVSFPKGAAAARLIIHFDNGTGVVKIDDLVISWF